MKETKFQIGKNGITHGVVESLNLALKTHDRVRISTLQASGRNKDLVKKMAEEIEKSVNYKVKSRIIGFTIILKRQSPRPKIQKNQQ